jgi:hypothetical protein
MNDVQSDDDENQTQTFNELKVQKQIMAIKRSCQP